jgi:TPR repeat protein
MRLATVIAACALAASGVAAAPADALKERELGMAYYAGHGVARDAAKAAQHLARAVDLGDAESAIRLGKMYEYGMGVGEDATQATLWYTRGAELGSAEAQFEASVRYYKGYGVARDPVEAVKWWTLSLEHGRASENRRVSIDSAEAKLSPEQISRGKALAQAWRERRTPSPARKAS